MAIVQSAIYYQKLLKVSWSVITSYSLERANAQLPAGRTHEEGALKDNGVLAKCSNTQIGHVEYLNLIGIILKRYLMRKVV